MKEEYCQLKKGVIVESKRKHCQIKERAIFTLTGSKSTLNEHTKKVNRRTEKKEKNVLVPNNRRCTILNSALYHTTISTTQPTTSKLGTRGKVPI